MRKGIVAAALGLGASTGAWAQVAAVEPDARPGVVLYGVADTNVTYQTHVPTVNGGKGNAIGFAEGPARGSRFGIQGAEDLGDGYQAIFVLESGIGLPTGKLDQQGQMFGRQAYVGLTARFGNTFQALAFGRQYGVVMEATGPYDPFYHGNIPATAWDLDLVGLRFDNSVEYVFNTGGLKLLFQYSPGGQAGSAADGTTIGTGFNYQYGFANVGAYAEQSKDAENRALKAFGAGGSAHLGPVILYGYYMSSLRDPGFTVGASNSGQALANASLVSNTGNVNQRRDNFYNLAVQYNVTPFVVLTFMYKHDIASAVNSAGDDGAATSYMLLANYAFSKRTSVYAYGTLTRLSGAEVKDTNAPTGTFGGASTQSLVGLGIQHLF